MYFSVIRERPNQWVDEAWAPFPSEMMVVAAKLPSSNKRKFNRKFISYFSYSQRNILTGNANPANDRHCFLFFTRERNTHLQYLSSLQVSLQTCFLT